MKEVFDQSIDRHLFQGSLPVLNASVSLGVEIQTGNGTYLGMSPRRMLDEGTGDDDMETGERRRK